MAGISNFGFPKGKHGFKVYQNSSAQFTQRLTPTELRSLNDAINAFPIDYTQLDALKVPMNLKTGNGLKHLQYAVSSLLDPAHILKTQCPRKDDGSILLHEMERPEGKASGQGTHDIYQLNHSASLLKVHKDSKKWTYQKRKDYLLNQNIANEKIKKYFGSHWIPEDLSIQKINDGTSHYAIISIVPAEAGFKSESKLGLNASDFRLDGSHPSNSAIFGSDSFDQSRLPDPISEFQHRIKSDQGFKDTMQDFLTKFKHYFAETGQFFDLTGDDNVIFFKDDQDQWTYKIGSVVKPINLDKLSKALGKLSEDINKGNDLQTKGAGALAKDGFMSTRFVLRESIRWIRSLNILGHMIGIGKVINNKSVNQIHHHWNKLTAYGVPNEL